MMNSQGVALHSLVHWSWLLSTLTSDLCSSLLPCAAGADGGGEAADPALVRVPELLRLQHPRGGASAGRGRRHLLRLQRPRPGGQRGVSGGVGWGGRRHMFAGVSVTQRGAGTESQTQSDSRLWLLCSPEEGLRVSFFKAAAGSKMAASRWRLSQCCFNFLRARSANLFSVPLCYYGRTPL